MFEPMELTNDAVIKVIGVGGGEIGRAWWRR